MSDRRLIDSPPWLRRSVMLLRRLLSSLDRRFGALPLPGWATPLTLALLALLIVQSLDHRYVRGSIPWTMIMIVSLGVLLGALYAALAYHDQRTIQVRQRPLIAALLVLLAANTMLHTVLLLPQLAAPQRYSIDAAAATDCATQQFLHGQDPYTNVHMLTCLASHGLQFWQTTPKRAGKFWSFQTYPTPNQPEAGVGSQTFENMLWQKYKEDLARERLDPRYVAPEFEERFNYPGGALLFALAAWTFGTRDLIGLFLAVTVLVSFLVYRRAVPRLRWVTGILLLADTPLLLDSAVGATDVLYGLLLVLYWQYRERPIVGGIILGLAAATRQQVWFFIPFLLYLAFRTGGWHDLRRRCAGALLVFFACNLPFILMGPGDWLAGMLAPMVDPLFAQGVGLIALAIAFTRGHLGPPVFYSMLEVLALIGLLRLYMRRWQVAPGLAMLLPLLPLVLAWRSLHTYFLILPLLATAVLACSSGGASREQAPEASLL